MGAQPVAFPWPRWFGFVDRLGDRVVARDLDGALVERLRLSADLGCGPPFAEALDSLVRRLEPFQHPVCVPARRVEGPDVDGRLVLVSDYVEGTRLSALLARSAAAGTPLATGAVLHVAHELASALAELHAQWLGAFHGLVGIDRVILTPDGRVRLTEYAVGGAVARHTSVGREDLWSGFGIAVPFIEGIPPFVPLADQIQLGVTVLSLLLNRPIGPGEYPGHLDGLLEEACETNLVGDRAPLGDSLNGWLGRCLLVSPQGPHPTMKALLAGLEDLLGDGGHYVEVSVGLDVDPEPLRPDEVAVHPGESLTEEPVSAAALQAVGSETASGESGEAPSAWRFERGNTLGDDSTGSLDDPPVEVVRYGDVGGYDPQAFEVATVVSAPSSEDVDGDLRPNTLPPWRPMSAPDTSRPVVETASATQTETLSDPIAPSPRPPWVSASGPAPLDPPNPPSAPQPLAAPLGEIEEPPTGEAARPPHLPSWLRDSPVTAEDGQPEGVKRATLRRLAPMLARLAVVLVVLAGVAGATWWVMVPGAPPVGWLRIDSRPTGAEVLVGGEVRGRTPAVIELPAGTHVVELRGIGTPALASITVTAGEQVSEVVALRDTRPDGTLSITTEPPGAEVQVDGEILGQTPLVINAIRPGEHVVVVRNPFATVERRVTIEPEQTAEFDVPLSGWLEVTAPLPLEVFDGDRRLGASGPQRMGVAAGRRRLILTNESVGFRLETALEIEAGRLTRVPVSLPNGWLTVTADVTADVEVNGQPVGQTPVPALELPLGMHRVVVSHPRHGDQTFTILVAIGSPTRVHATLTAGPVRGRTGTQRRVR